MSGHRSWHRLHEDRLRRLDAARYAAYRLELRLTKERIEREVWLVEVEGWLQRSLTAARFGQDIEPLA